jgi:predicted phosphoribosyltransferase
LIFADRREAGRRLGDRLLASFGPGVVVLGIPRGGVVVAAEVARVLRSPLDVVVPHKIGAPFNDELAIGAIAPGVRVLDEGLIQTLRVNEGYLTSEIARQEREIARRSEAYRQGVAPLEVSGRDTLIVDDGVATGSTAVAAIRWAKATGASRVVFAAPVGPPGSDTRLESEADRAVLLATPADFLAVGQFYLDFSQVSDDDVMSALAGAMPPARSQRREVESS